MSQQELVGKQVVQRGATHGGSVERWVENFIKNNNEQRVTEVANRWSEALPDLLNDLKGVYVSKEALSKECEKVSRLIALELAQMAIYLGIARVTGGESAGGISSRAQHTGAVVSERDVVGESEARAIMTSSLVGDLSAYHQYVDDFLKAFAGGSGLFSSHDDLLNAITKTAMIGGKTRDVVADFMLKNNIVKIVEAKQPTERLASGNSRMAESGGSRPAAEQARAPDKPLSAFDRLRLKIVNGFRGVESFLDGAIPGSSGRVTGHRQTQRSKHERQRSASRAEKKEPNQSQVDVFTEKGPKSSGNADYYYTSEHDKLWKSYLGYRFTLEIVADGVGSTREGNVASKAATKAFRNYLFNSLSSSGRSGGSVTPNKAMLNRAIIAANRAVGENTTEGSTTLAVALVDKKTPKLLVAGVGDSKVYAARKDEATSPWMVKQLLDEHSWVAEKVREGSMDPEEALNHSNRNIITSSLGSEPPREICLKEFDLTSGSELVLLVCTDGCEYISTRSDGKMIDGLSELFKQAVVRGITPEQFFKWLRKVKMDGGGYQDDTTGVMRKLKVESSNPRPVA